MSRLRSAWKRFWRFVDRWDWFIFGLAAVGAVSRGDAFGAVAFGLLTGIALNERFRSDPPRNEIRISLGKEDAKRLRREAEEALEAGLPAKGAE